MENQNNRNNLPDRPSDDLPPDQLREKWNEYLDAHVNPVKMRPQTTGKNRTQAWEVLMTPEVIDRVLAQSGIVWPKTELPQSPKIKLYIQALENVIRRLPVMRRVILGRYFGIDLSEEGMGSGRGMEPQTQQEIAIDLKQTQQRISRILAKELIYLKGAVEKEATRLLRDELKEPPTEEGVT